MFKSTKMINYRIDELENKIIALEETIEILKEHIIDVEKKFTASTYNLEKKFDELERKHSENT